jgi:hypothetical protein
MPAFVSYGGTRADYPFPFHRVMSFSGLFEAWRVVQSGDNFLVLRRQSGLLAEGLDDLMQSDHVNGFLG